MVYTVRQPSWLAGVSVPMLRYHDGIGLLGPKRCSAEDCHRVKEPAALPEELPLLPL